MDKYAFIAGLIDAFFFIGLFTHALPYSTQFSGMMPLTIVCIWVISYGIVRAFIYASYGVPFPWDKEGWKEHNSGGNNE